jgi:tetratricopeptide (TPR) repeat protein
MPRRRRFLRRSAAAALLLGLAANTCTAAPGAAFSDAGIRLFEDQRYPEARSALEAAVAENPRDSRAAAYLGRVFFEENDLDRAVEWLEKAAALDPTSAHNVYWLGRAWGVQAIRGNMLVRARLAGKIRRAFSRAVELAPDNVDARTALLEFYLRAPGFLGGSFAKARGEVEEIRRRDPLRGHRAMGRIEEYQRHWERAAAEYDAAIREFPSCSDPYYWMEKGAIDRKDWAAALESMERALRFHRDDAGPLYEIGRLAALSGHALDRGEESLRLYFEHQPKGDEPSLALAHARLAEILERRGDRIRARDEVAAALRLDPGLLEAREARARLR